MALKQEAKAWYKKMFVTSPEEDIRIVEELRQALSCVHAVYGHKYSAKNINEYNELIDKIRILPQIENNFWRKSWFDKKNKFSVSGSYRGPENNILKSLQYCQFEIRELKLILQAYYDQGRHKENSSPEEMEEFLNLLKEEK